MLSIAASGGFADIIDLGDGTVAKVYRHHRHCYDDVEDDTHHDFITQKLFEVEARAYECIQSEPNLTNCTPRYFGRLDTKTLALGPSSTGEPYLPGCAFRIERLSGADRKIATVGEPLRSEIERSLQAIRQKVGDLHTIDASCFVPGPRGKFVLIDFALWTGLSDAQLHLSSNRELTPQVRAELLSQFP